MKLMRLFSHYVKLNLQSAMEYRAAFLTQVFGMILNNSAFIVFWLVLFRAVGDDIAGWGFTAVMFLWSITAFGFGLASVFLGNALYLSRIIYTGELDVYLLQPKPILPNVLWSRSIVSGWGDAAYGLVLFGLTQPLSVAGIAIFLGFGVALALVLTAIRVIYHSLTFYFGNAEDFATTAGELVILFSMYPGGVFDGPTMWLLHSVIPAALVAFIPAQLFASFDTTLLLAVLAADALIIAGAVIVFARGVRRYESGNRIGARL